MVGLLRLAKCCLHRFVNFGDVFGWWFLSEAQNLPRFRCEILVGSVEVVFSTPASISRMRPPVLPLPYSDDCTKLHCTKPPGSSLIGNLPGSS